MGATKPTRVKVIVLHSAYGCESGCCGHIVTLWHGNQIGNFDFDHPRGNDDKREWAIGLAQKALTTDYDAEHIADLVWEDCSVLSYAEC